MIHFLICYPYPSFIHSFPTGAHQIVFVRWAVSRVRKRVKVPPLAWMQIGCIWEVFLSGICTVIMCGERRFSSTNRFWPFCFSAISDSVLYNVL